MNMFDRIYKSCIQGILVLGAVFAADLCAGSIVGIIRDAQTDKILEKAIVVVRETKDTVYSDSSGFFAIDSLTPASYNLVIKKSGFDPQTRNDIYVAGKGAKRLEIKLVPQIYALEKMVVHSTSFHRAPEMASSTKIMNADEILRAPGALTDIQRVLQNLPSVTSGGDNVNEVVVRGGLPGENMLIMDNIEIPNPNHFADQRTGGGVISLINPLLVKGLTFNAGAPPAQYGGKASSVIDVELREGNDVMVIGGLDMGMAGMGGHVEGPLWKGANFIASAHKSYLDLIANVEPSLPVPEFWGLQSKLTQHIGEHTLFANGIYGKNSITIKDLKEQQDMNYDIIESGGIIYAAGLSWDARWTDRLTSLITLAGTGNTYDRLAFTKANESRAADTTFFGGSWVDEQTLKARLAYDLPNNNRIQLGGYVKRAEFLVDQREKPDTLKDYSDTTNNGVVVIDPQTNRPVVYGEYANVHDTTYKFGGFVSAILHAFDRLRIVPGLRCDGFTYNNSFSVAPRINMVYALNESSDLTAAFGLQYQDPDYVDLGLDPSNKSLKPKRALTGIVGVEHYIEPLGIKIVGEGFYKHYKNLLFDAALLTLDSLDETDKISDHGEAHSFGIELFAQKKLTESIFWTGAYAFSRSIHKDLRPGHEGEWYDGDYDFRHSFTVTAGWKKELIQSETYKRKFHDKLWFKLLSPIMPFADRMEFSMKWRFLSGRPYTQQRYDDRIYKRWYQDPLAPLNAERHAPYHRLDLRYERRFGFGFLQMIYYIDLQNLYSRDNIWTFLYPEYDPLNPNQTIERKEVMQFPFFPAGGIIIGF